MQCVARLFVDGNFALHFADDKNVFSAVFSKEDKTPRADSPWMVPPSQSPPPPWEPPAYPWEALQDNISKPKAQDWTSGECGSSDTHTSQKSKVKTSQVVVYPQHPLELIRSWLRLTKRPLKEHSCNLHFEVEALQVMFLFHSVCSGFCVSHILTLLLVSPARWGSV